MAGMPRILTITRLGNPILRKPGKTLTVDEITSEAIQRLIADMLYTLAKKEYGVGLAAPQVGRRVALSVIGIKPTPNRPELDPFEAVIINPVIIETYGEPIRRWEACISCGTGGDLLFAQVPRYERIKLRWLNEDAVHTEKVLDGLVAHVAQHETDHTNGVMFVDRVDDPRSYMMADEYRRRILANTASPAKLARA
jgi:peptide deformylase